MSNDNLYNGFIRGSIAGITSSILTHPIDLIKVRIQLNKSKKLTIFETAKNIIKNEGIMSLNKGLSASIMRQGIFAGTKFGLYEQWKYCYGNDLSFQNKVLGGLFSGGVSAIIGNPFDVAMVRMQADGSLPIEKKRNYKNVGNAITRIVKEEGITTLWRGSIPTISRSCIITASQFSIYDQTKESLIKVDMFGDTLLTYATSSVVCSIISGIVSNPIDIVKTRQMNNEKNNNGMLNTLVKIIKEEGPSALFKGTTPTIVRQIPLNSIRFLVIEFLKKNVI